MGQLALAPDERDWLSRCLECNGALERGVTESLLGHVPERVLTFHTEFMRCGGCARIYRAGSRAERMKERLSRLLGTGRSA